MDFKKDYYAILEITQNANSAQIKRAYRHLALKWHPDRVPDGAKEEAEQIFKEIVEAFYVLGNQNSRMIYDRQRGIKPNFYKPPPTRSQTTTNKKESSLTDDVVLDEFYRKERAHYTFQSPDWIEILGGTKAKILAFVLLALHIVINFYIPQFFYSKFSFYGGYRLSLIPFGAFLYIAIEPIREYFSPNDEISCQLYLILSWLGLVGPLFFIAFALLSGERWSMCRYAVCG
jgi:hypothetical protein